MGAFDRLLPAHLVLRILLRLDHFATARHGREFAPPGSSHSARSPGATDSRIPGTYAQPAGFHRCELYRYHCHIAHSRRAVDASNDPAGPGQHIFDHSRRRGYRHAEANQDPRLVGSLSGPRLIPHPNGEEEAHITAGTPTNNWDA